MNLLCNYTRQEVLTVVAEHAGKTLPPNSDGVLRAVFLDDGSIEIFFVEKKNDSKNSECRPS